jgi:predicted RNase H-like HicB family nuclease
VNEIVFEVTQEADGGFTAECLTESIFTQGDTWTELCANVKEAVEAFYFDGAKPAGVRLPLVRDEVLTLG